VTKSYYAVVIGKMNPKGSITEKIDSKESRTDYRICASVRSEKYDALSLVQLFPQTGRRHQIRKHLSCMGNPILGDQEYGQEGLILKGRGMYLHAYSLAFSHPFSNKSMYFLDLLPEKFSSIFTNLKQV
jgi:23S rRNA pseudouridine1911/1915/1917 synthase